MTATNWDIRFLRLAEHVSTWSRDPSTQCGAVIVRPDRTVASMGYNGFPRGCSDDSALYADRETKLARVVHAEMNAILTASGPIAGCTLYVWPFLTCERCAVHIIQAGIRRVVAPLLPVSDPRAQRWASSFRATRSLYREARIICDEVQLTC